MSAVLDDNTEMDIDQVSNDLAADLSLGLGGEPKDDKGLDTSIDNAADTTTADQRARDDAGKFAKTAAAPAVDPNAPALGADDLPVPKSWAKGMHPIWDKLAKGVPLSADESKRAAKYYNEREGQMAEGAKAYGTDAEYGRSLKGVLGQHEDFLRSQGLDAPRAVGYLMNAHRQLSSGTPEQKQAYLAKVAETYGIQMTAPAAADPNAPAPAALPAEVKAALAKVEQFESAFSQEAQRRQDETRAAIGSEVNAFADAKDEKGNPKAPYFEECADHICLLLKGDPKMKLQDAYDTAVWANPVTRQKELARIQQETDKANRERAEAAAKAARKGTSTNVKGRDTARAPQAPAAKLDNLDDVMRETHAEIKSRTD